MRTTVKNLRALVRATLREDVQKPQASDDDELGQYAFAKDRIDKKLPDEEDTPEEQKLFRNLAGHFNDNDPLGADSTLLMRDLLRKNVYTSVFNEPNPGDVLYRGFSVGEDWVRNHLDLPADRELPSKGSATKQFLLKSHKGPDKASSWTTSRMSAVAFSTQTKGNPISVILHAKASDNPRGFVMGDGGLYNVKKFSTFRAEEEVLALGPIRVSKIEWSSEPPEYSDASFDVDVSDLKGK